MNNKKKDFLDFLINSKPVPGNLQLMVQKEILLSFQKKSILLKFMMYQLLGAAFSLTVCPQFGIGFVEGHGISHAFRMIGDWACAAFCSSLFLSAGALLAFIGMKGEEVWFVWKRYRVSAIFLPAFLWGSLMLVNKTLNLEEETVSYHLIWVMTAFLVQYLWMRFRTNLYFLPAD